MLQNHVLSLSLKSCAFPFELAIDFELERKVRVKEKNSGSDISEGAEACTAHAYTCKHNPANTCPKCGLLSENEEVSLTHTLTCIPAFRRGRAAGVHFLLEQEARGAGVQARRPRSRRALALAVTTEYLS